MITLHLYGSLKESFGGDFQISARSPAEAVRIMEANFPGRFLKAFSTGGFFVVRGKDLETGFGDDEDTLVFEMDEDIHIMPEIEGAGSGLFKVILGAIIVIVAVVMAVASYGGTSGFSAAMAQTAFGGMSYASIAMFGASLMLGGIAEMLTPTPEMPGALGGSSVDPKSSYTFNGTENIVAQGVPVPIVYGEVETGSVVMAVSLTVEDADSTIRVTNPVLVTV